MVTRASRGGRLTKAKLAQRMGTDTAFRRAYTRLFVDAVHVSNDQIEIAGSKAALEAAVVNSGKAPLKAVPSFDREWCPEEDSNLHDLAIAST